MKRHTDTLKNWMIGCEKWGHFASEQSFASNFALQVIFCERKEIRLVSGNKFKYIEFL